MIDRLYYERDDELGRVADKLNEVIDFLNNLPQTGFASYDEEQEALNQALDPHA